MLCYSHFKLCIYILGMSIPENLKIGIRNFKQKGNGKFRKSENPGKFRKTGKLRENEKFRQTEKSKEPRKS